MTILLLQSTARTSVYKDLFHVDHPEHSSFCLPPATASVPVGYVLETVQYGCQETILIGICSSFTHI